MILKGIDGSNPLGFLAALGTLRLVSCERPTATMRWIRDSVWRPEILGIEGMNESRLCELLSRAPAAPVQLFSKHLGKNITVDTPTFSNFARESAAGACAADRRASDFAAAFGSEVCADEKKNRIEYTSLCFITGSGHQDFLGTMKALTEKVDPTHLGHALFERWTYSEKGLSLRWDPSEAKEYALRWSDPGPEGAWTEWGANRLAFESLPLFTAHPTSNGLRTTAFKSENRTDAFTWPIWVDPVSCDTVRSLVGLSELQEATPDREILGAMGISEVYRAQRIRIGVGANFKVSFRPARAV